MASDGQIIMQNIVANTKKFYSFVIFSFLLMLFCSS